MTPRYQLLLPPETREKLVVYREELLAGKAQEGRYLHQQLADHPPGEPRTFLETLLNTKRPQIFAESAVFGDGRDWNPQELSILGDIGIAVPVTVYDNGRHTAPDVHETPFPAHLLYVPGALLANGRGHTPADWDEVTSDGALNPEGYYRLYERRLLPALRFANDTAASHGKQALVTIPGLGCGQFAGPFCGRLGAALKQALESLLRQHGSRFPAIRAVYYDPYRECDNERSEIHGISFMARPLTKGNEGKPQLCLPERYGEAGDDFGGCELFSVVAWDHVSWPGNDFYVGSRVTDDGVKAAATDSMFGMTGVEGAYSGRSFSYEPPAGYGSWLEVVVEKGIRLRVGLPGSQAHSI